MIEKLLIANRGEIAARIIRTCKKMKIKTVAIYSEADEFSPYVEMADEKYLIGPSHVNESYLNTERILEIAKKANVCAIHPGYGFLSENSNFARMCIQAEFIFIGPSPEVLENMGDKITARKLMQRAGVPIIPGTEDPVVSVEQGKQKAKQIGYPLMLKASAGGGGVGLQIVKDELQLEKTFENNSKRAETLFGDGSMFIEKLLVNSRHIEVQIAVDEHNNALHFYERECSIQRRNQKVIEEAPSPFLSDSIRRKMVEAAIQAVKEINYTSVGTIEFLVDENEDFYFLEMNTRIQVEHPVTEEITGVDLIAIQIDIANGKQLNISQDDIQINGHSIEARIYAEDPKTHFPSPGKITEYVEPKGNNVRIESSVRNYTTVTPFYDPMISKLIIKGETRDEAILKMKEALSDYRIEGIKTNISMLLDTINNEHFISGNTTTDFIKKYM